MAPDRGDRCLFIFVWARRLFFHVFPFPVCKAELIGDWYESRQGAPNTINFLIMRQYYWRTDAPCANRNGGPNRKIKLLAHNVWSAMPIGAGGHRCANILAHRWFHKQSRQSAGLFSSRRNWDFPNPSLAGENALPLVSGWVAHSVAREGVWESQFWRGDINCGYSINIVLCGFKKRRTKQFGAPRLFSSQSPINWALQTGNGNTLKTRRQPTSIAMVRNHVLAVACFLTPLPFHYPLPLSTSINVV